MILVIYRLLNVYKSRYNKFKEVGKVNMENKDQKTMTNREINAIETRNVLYTTALSLFSSKGFENVKIIDITNAAGFSKGSFYTYFKSKEYVLVEFFRRIDDYYDEAYKNITTDTPASEQLLTIINAMTVFCTNNCGVNALSIIYSHQITSHSLDSKVLSDKNRHFFNILHKIVRHGKSTGEFRKDINDDDMITLIERSCHGLLYDWCLYNGLFDLVEAGQNYFKKVLVMISA